MKRKAFTLVELLVVLAIIGILIGLILPVIKAARNAAKKDGQQHPAAALKAEAEEGVVPGTGSNAKTAVPKLLSPVNDYANVLAPQEAEQLRSRLLSQERRTSNQIVILTLPTINDDAANDFAVKVYETWGLGQKGKDNGVLILQVTGSRDIWITTGYGMGGPVPDITCGRIYRNEMVPKFKEGKFYEGYVAAIDAIEKAVQGEYVAVAPPVAQARPQQQNEEWSVWVYIGIGILVILVIIFIVSAINDLRNGDFPGSSFLGFLAEIAEASAASGGSHRGGGSSGGSFGGGFGGSSGGSSGGGGYSGGGGSTGGGGAGGKY